LVLLVRLWRSGAYARPRQAAERRFCLIPSGAYSRPATRGQQGRPAPRRHQMPRYLISFDDGSMDHIPYETGPRWARPRTRSSRKPRTQASGSAAAAWSASKRPSWAPTAQSQTAGPRDEGGRRGLLDHRDAAAGGGAGVGCSDRGRMPLRAGGSGGHVRPGLLREGGVAARRRRQPRPPCGRWRRARSGCRRSRSHQEQGPEPEAHRGLLATM